MSPQKVLGPKTTSRIAIHLSFCRIITANIPYRSFVTLQTWLLLAVHKSTLAEYMYTK